MNADALVIGESLIDKFVESDYLSLFPGGSPTNVALGLCRLNLVTCLHTAIGDDENGDLIREHMGASGVILTTESSTDQPTSEAVATLAPDGSATYDFALSWDPNNLHELGTPKVIHAGSLGAFLEPASEVRNDILRRGRSSGVVVTFDPNMRPSLVRNAHEALKRFMTLARMSHFTKLSDEDAGFLGAGDSSWRHLLWALIFGHDGWDGDTVSQRRLEDIGGKAGLAAAITVSRRGADLPVLNELTTDNLAV